jgi:hypothetical protein
VGGDNRVLKAVGSTGKPDVEVGRTAFESLRDGKAREKVTSSATAGDEDAA